MKGIKLEWGLICIAYNIERLAKIIIGGWGKIVTQPSCCLPYGSILLFNGVKYLILVIKNYCFGTASYYLTVLINLLGPIKRVTDSARISFFDRTITSAKKCETKIEVEVPTHIAGVMDFECGAVGTIITSFDVWSSQLPNIEIYGSGTTLRVPDPNTFDGPVYIKMKNTSEWKDIPLTHNYLKNWYKIDLTDMAWSLINGHNHSANGEMAYHVLDAMQGFIDSSNNSTHYFLKSSCTRPNPLPPGLSKGEIDK